MSLRFLLISKLGRMLRIDHNLHNKVKYDEILYTFLFCVQLMRKMKVGSIFMQNNGDWIWLWRGFFFVHLFGSEFHRSKIVQRFHNIKIVKRKNHTSAYVVHAPSYYITKLRSFEIICCSLKSGFCFVTPTFLVCCCVCMAIRLGRMLCNRVSVCATGFGRRIPF